MKLGTVIGGIIEDWIILRTWVRHSIVLSTDKKEGGRE